MASYIRNDSPTPSGGAYSEIHFFDDKGTSVDEKKATRCVIRECAANGDLINEIWGECIVNQNRSKVRKSILKR
jgi:hypothetical protein